MFLILKVNFISASLSGPARKTSGTSKSSTTRSGFPCGSRSPAEQGGTISFFASVRFPPVNISRTKTISPTSKGSGLMCPTVVMKTLFHFGAILTSAFSLSYITVQEVAPGPQVSITALVKFISFFLTCSILLCQKPLTVRSLQVEPIGPLHSNMALIFIRLSL